MNPLLAKQLNDITHMVRELRDLFRDRHAQLTEHERQRQEAIQEGWQLKSEVAILKRQGEDYERLQSELKALRSRLSKTKEGLSRILNFAKALGNEYRQ
ncbi:MAG: hypothetical protein HY706_19370 [Candidatus Hydrogenedentes bacterium]|nr:hypothetical protein [Candidatus Hydrogenedentota bacterium]